MNKFNIHNNTLGLARSLLALGSLLTLLCESFYDICPEKHFEDIKKASTGITKYNLFLLFDYHHFAIPYWICVFVLLLVISGVYPRITCIPHAIVSYSMYYMMLIIEGGDQITCILTLLLVPVCIFDFRNNHWFDNKFKDKPYIIKYFSYSAMLFIQFQMALLYLDAGIEKMKVPAWTEGTAVYYWFNHNVFGAPVWLRLLTAPLLSNSIVITLINWGVMILEVLLFTSKFLKQKYRYRLFAVGLFFHLLIFLFHGLATFGIAMSAGLVLLLWRSDLNIQENLKRMKNSLHLSVFKANFSHPENLSKTSFQ